MRESVPIEKLRDHRSISAITEHSDFDRCDLQIFRQCVKLRAQRRGGGDVIGFDAHRRLHGKRGDRSYAVTILRGKSFEVAPTPAPQEGSNPAMVRTMGKGLAIIIQNAAPPVRRESPLPQALEIAGNANFTRVIRRNATFFSGREG